MKRNNLQDAMKVVSKENKKLDAFDCAQIAYARKCIELQEVRTELKKLKLQIN